MGSARAKDGEVRIHLQILYLNNKKHLQWTLLRRLLADPPLGAVFAKRLRFHEGDDRSRSPERFNLPQWALVEAVGTR